MLFLEESRAISSVFRKWNDDLICVILRTAKLFLVGLTQKLDNPECWSVWKVSLWDIFYWVHGSLKLEYQVVVVGCCVVNFESPMRKITSITFEGLLQIKREWKIKLKSNNFCHLVASNGFFFTFFSKRGGCLKFDTFLFDPSSLIS